MNVVWSPLAIERAVEQALHIARDKPGAARSWLLGLFARTARLSALPRLGRIVPELSLPDFRELDIGGYRVIYRVTARQVSILTVRHGRRRLDLSELKSKAGPE